MAKAKPHINQLAQALSPETYPWRNHNAIQLLVNGEEFFPHMLASIDLATNKILLEMYLIESGQVADSFIAAFIKAANRGVKIYLLLDDFGSRGFTAFDRKRLSHPNIFVSYYNPLHYGAIRRNLFRDHRKILLVDNQIAYIGGVGLTDHFIDTDANSPGWRETVIALQGDCVRDWQDAFCRVWNFYSDEILEPSLEGSVDVDDVLPCRVNCTIGGAKQGIKRSLIKRIRSAERQCWIATAYFMPAYKVRRALARAARRGVDVRIFLPGEKTDHPAVRHAGRRFYYRLLKAGVKIYEYQPRFLHQKVLVCDSWVSIGSSNIDRWNFRWNLEANQEIEDQDFVNQVIDMLQQDSLQCVPCELKDWERRSRYNRLQEWFWGYVDRLLDRFLR